MRKQGSGRPPGSRNKKEIHVVCKWIECQEDFIAFRAGAMFCSVSCSERHYLREKMLKTKEVVSCRVCGEPIQYNKIKEHFSLHNIRLK